MRSNLFYQFSVLILLGCTVQAQAQNVGVGTNQPETRLHVAGALKADSSIIIQPITYSVADTISVSRNDGFIVISSDSTTQSNVVSMAGAARSGQFLGISNQDNDEVSFEAFTIPTGMVGLYLYDGSSWNAVQGNPSELIDANGDTKVQVEASTDEDLIRFTVDGTERMVIYPHRIHLFDGYEGNLVLGYNAGSNLTNQSLHNTVIGYKSGLAMTSAEENVALGYLSLESLTDGINNVGIGSKSLEYNNGQGNVALGQSSCQGTSINSGSGNTTLGAYAGNKLNGNYNVIIGNYAGFNNQGSSNIFIGRRAGYYETGSNRLYIDNSNTTSPLIYGELDSNLLRINGTLDINNSYQFPDSTGSNGQAMMITPSGSLGWGTMNSLGDADYDTKMEVEASTDEDIIRFHLAGSEMWTMIGERLESTSTNTLIGKNAGLNMNTGTGNSALGYESLQANTSGTNNAAFGSYALTANISGLYNASLGTNSGFSQTSGDRNTYVGNSAGYSNVSGSNNTFVGQFAGYSNLGSDNVFIGRYAGGNDTSSNKLYIANSNTSSPLIYGEFDSELVHINGDLMPGTGNIYDLGSSTNKWNTIYAKVGTIQTSDRRFKRNIQDLSYGLEELLLLHSVSYEWIDDTAGITNLGFIAQELEQVIPEVVNIANDSMQTRGVNYAELVPLLVNAIQEQQVIIQSQEKLIGLNQQENAAQNVRLMALEARLTALLSTSASK